MRYIEKGHEPAAQRAQREIPGATYAAIEAVRVALAKEQGYVCAFCMRKLDLTARDEHGQPRTKIAHLLSRHPKNANPVIQEERRLLGMDYRNMVLTCDGRAGDAVHCDEQQGNTDITVPLFDRAEMEHIAFTPRGEVRHPRFQGQIGLSDAQPGQLNLNTAALVDRRRERWLAVATTLQQQGRWKAGELEKLTQVWNNKDKHEQLREDCQCVTYFLRQKLAQLRSQPKLPSRRDK